MKNTYPPLQNWPGTFAGGWTPPCVKKQQNLQHEEPEKQGGKLEKGPIAVLHRCFFQKKRPKHTPQIHLPHHGETESPPPVCRVWTIKKTTKICLMVLHFVVRTPTNTASGRSMLFHASLGGVLQTFIRFGSQNQFEPHFSVHKRESQKIWCTQMKHKEKMWPRYFEGEPRKKSIHATESKLIIDVSFCFKRANTKNFGNLFNNSQN